MALPGATAQPTHCGEMPNILAVAARLELQQIALAV